MGEVGNLIERLEGAECEECGGLGKIVEEARMNGANQHSACQRDCDECDGTGRIPTPEETVPLDKIGAGERVSDRTTGERGTVQWVDGDKRGVVLVLFDSGKTHVALSRDLEQAP